MIYSFFTFYALLFLPFLVIIKKISWYISQGAKKNNSYPEWYGVGAVPPIIAVSDKEG